MLIRLHKKATNPATSEYIRFWSKGIKTLVHKLGLHPANLRKWRGEQVRLALFV
jgi:hypothetical protein